MIMEMDMITELTIEPGYSRRLIFKMRVNMFGDQDTPRDARDNASERDHLITLNEKVDTDARREELVERTIAWTRNTRSSLWP